MTESQAVHIGSGQSHQSTAPLAGKSLAGAPTTRAEATMNIALWTAQVLWGVFFSVTGFGKVLWYKPALWNQALHEVPWLPAVPQGAVTITYSVGGEQHETTGAGYHDHNWGNVALMKVVHDWYWARGQAGPYSVIASYITAAKQYGFEPIPIFMLARDNVLIGDEPAKVTFEREGVYTDQATGKPVAATTRYTYSGGEDRYVVSFTRSHDLSDTRMIDTIKGLKYIAAKLAHFDGAYLRFTGDIEISRYRGGELAETHKDEAIWELMYFGHTRDQ